MKLIQTKNANVNYLAKIVNITTFKKHPNADKMKIAVVNGYEICVGLDENEGKYVYFPANCTINPKLLSYLSLYKHTELNANPEKSGFFQDNGRVTAIKLRGVVSEGFLMKLGDLNSFLENAFNLALDETPVNIEFDAVQQGEKELWICKKYIVVNKIKKPSDAKVRHKTPGYDRLVPGQFNFHYDTVQVKREPWCIEPGDVISLTSKIHGTSHISAYVLCKKPRNIIQKVWDRWKHNTPTQYDYIYASRSVIKNRYYNKHVTDGYYGIDIWAEADKVLRPHLKQGMTIYAEIVGFLPDGNYIQKDYDYGCVPPEKDEQYTSEKHFKVRPYRITLTNILGEVYEFSAREVQIWCKNNGLIPVTELYYGYAKDLYPDIMQDDNWNTSFWEHLANDKTFYMECNSPDCTNKVPQEGIVIKKEDMRPHAWKLKTFAFMSGEAKQLDAGETNIEDNA